MIFNTGIGGASTAETVRYDNSLSELEATNVQEAVDELASEKVDKVIGKGLSSNDYTTTEKNKLSGIADGANKTIVDAGLSNGSTNPVQNKVVTTKFNELSDSLGGITQFVVDETTGKISGYKTEIGGADTVFPFKSIPSKTQTVTNTVNNKSVVFTFDELEEVVGVVAMSATPTTAYSTDNFYIEDVSGNTVTVKTYRGNNTAPYSVELTCIGY